jgi:hypothetical protein
MGVENEESRKNLGSIRVGRAIDAVVGNIYRNVRRQALNASPLVPASISARLYKTERKKSTEQKTMALTLKSRECAEEAAMPELFNG